MSITPEYSAKIKKYTDTDCNAGACHSVRTDPSPYRSDVAINESGQYLADIYREHQRKPRAMET